MTIPSADAIKIYRLNHDRDETIHWAITEALRDYIPRANVPSRDTILSGLGDAGDILWFADRLRNGPGESENLFQYCSECDIEYGYGHKICSCAAPQPRCSREKAIEEVHEHIEQNFGPCITESHAKEIISRLEQAGVRFEEDE